jgi:2-polyprenyl-6-methoxyphenol hydroxylase-like FAD-dependent oxidoreductase
MESALVLSRRLAGAPDPVGALRSYEAERQKRTASMTVLSRRIGAMGRVKNPVGVAMREQFMKRVFGRVALPKQEQDLLIDV